MLGTVLIVILILAFVGSIAAVVKLGLCSVGWRRPRDRHPRHSRASWAYLGMSPIVGG